MVAGMDEPLDSVTLDVIWTVSLPPLISISILLNCVPAVLPGRNVGVTPVMLTRPLESLLIVILSELVLPIRCSVVVPGSICAEVIASSWRISRG
jgi:hypothetical protein